MPDLAVKGMFVDLVKSIPYDFGWAASNKNAFVKKFTDIKMDLGL